MVRTESDRRAEGITRVPFDARVEVGGELGPVFEAQAVNISGGGMQLRTAYLPDLGQKIKCRFDNGDRHPVLAEGDVVWRQEGKDGGEFGIRFTNLGPETANVLSHIVGVTGTTVGPAAERGSKVRLHLSGLGSPMRARVRESQDGVLTVGSELGFLKVGKELELENPGTGDKRPARIDRVEVEVDPTSQVPYLVVGLRYGGDADEIHVEHESTPEPSVVSRGDSEPSPAAGNSRPAHAAESRQTFQDTQREVRDAFERGAKKVVPAFQAFARKTWGAAASVAHLRSDTDPAGPRRMTAPPPAGALHAEGRKVVRGEAMRALQGPDASFDRRKVALGGAVGIAVVLAVLALRKPADPPAPSTTAAAVAPPVEPPASQVTPAPVEPRADPPPAAPVMPQPVFQPPVEVQPRASAPESRDREAAEDTRVARRPFRAPSFGNAVVSHGNVLHLRMDGPIEKIQGASQPTGFTVQIPNRKSLEPAAPLASRDSRIASIHVANEADGAELVVVFKDGVPNYQVRAKGETLEIALSPMGSMAADSPSSQNAAPSSGTRNRLLQDLAEPNPRNSKGRQDSNRDDGNSDLTAPPRRSRNHASGRTDVDDDRSGGSRTLPALPRR